MASEIDLSGLTQQETELAAMAASGGFTVDPDAAREAAAICGHYAQRLRELVGLLPDASPFLGSCWVGNNLNAHYSHKVTGGSSSYAPTSGGLAQANTVVGEVELLAERVVDLARILNQVAGAYANNEQDVSDDIKGSAQQLK